MRTPWSTTTSVEGGNVRVTVMLTTDGGPVREFRPYIDVNLDEAHATELLGELAIALRTLRETRARSVEALPNQAVSAAEELRDQ